MSAKVTALGARLYKKSWEDFFTDLSGVDYPCVLIDKHDFSYSDRKSDNIQKVREVSFIVCDYVDDKSNEMLYDAALDNSERIVDELIFQIRNDAKYPFNSPLTKFDLNEVQCTEVENEAIGVYGFYVTITITDRAQ